MEIKITITNATLTSSWLTTCVPSGFLDCDDVLATVTLRFLRWIVFSSLGNTDQSGNGHKLWVTRYHWLCSKHRKLKIEVMTSYKHTLHFTYHRSTHLWTLFDNYHQWNCIHIIEQKANNVSETRNTEEWNSQCKALSPADNIVLKI